MSREGFVAAAYGVVFIGLIVYALGLRLRVFAARRQAARLESDLAELERASK